MEGLRPHADSRRASLVVRVENPRRERAGAKAQGIGVANATNRLRLLSGEGASLSLDLSQTGRGSAQVLIPLPGRSRACAAVPAATLRPTARRLHSNGSSSATGPLLVRHDARRAPADRRGQLRSAPLGRQLRARRALARQLGATARPRPLLQGQPPADREPRLRRQGRARRRGGSTSGCEAALTSKSLVARRACFARKSAPDPKRPSTRCCAQASSRHFPPWLGRRHSGAVVASLSILSPSLARQPLVARRLGRT